MTAQQVEALPEKEAGRVLDAWVKARRSELPVALRESGSKVHARLAKKALYQLQSSGVTVAEAPKPAAPVVEAKETNEFPAVLSHQISSGERAFFFAVPFRGGQGLEIFAGIVHDQLGLLQLSNEQANRAQYRKRLKDLESRADSRVMLVPHERLKLELGRALTLNERSKTELTGEMTQVLQRLKITPQDPDVVVPPLEPGDAEGRADGVRLHELIELAEWLPPETDLAMLSSQVSALDILPIDAAKKAEKKETLAKSLAQQIFTRELKTVYARRLLYTAELLENRGRSDDAAKVRAEARRLAHEKELTPFAERIFTKAIATAKAPSALGSR